MNKAKLSPGAKIYMALILIFLYAPIAVMAVFRLTAVRAPMFSQAFPQNGGARCFTIPRPWVR